ncbi:hypothetical protein BT69DRAFT_897413 [Atractiella rhizophila]|nr:hypothetical protein BT69DRAFT_897413 [Atractiella rhizophila]
MGPMETLPEYYVPMCASLARLLFQCHRQLHLRLQRTFSPSSVQEIDGLAEMDGLSQIWPISNNKVDKEIAFLSELFQRVLTDPVRRKAPSLLTIRHLVNALLQLPDGVERLSRLLLLDPGLRIQVLQTLKTFAFAFPDVVDVITKLEGPPAPMSNLSMSPAPPPPTALPMPHQTSPTPAPPEMLHFFGAMQDRNIFAGNPPSAVVVSSPPNFLPGSPTLRSLHGMSIHGLQPPMTPDPFAAQQLPVDGTGGWYQNYFFDNNLRG